MTTPSLSQLYTPLTADQVLASILNIAEEVGLPIEAWQAEGVAREILTIVATSEAEFSQTAVILASLGLLSFAEGEGLTLLAYELYDVTRIEATSGTTTVTLTNTSGVSYPIAAGDLRFYNVDPVNGGATYTNTTGGTLLGLGTLDITVQADTPGTASNAGVGDISGMQTPLTGVSATNADALVGTDEESDSALRTRCRESLAKASPNGPRDAYNYFAKTTVRADGSNAGVTRTAINDGNATIIVYLASADGVVESSDVSLVDANIQANCVPTGFTATVVTADAVTIPVTATVYLSQGSTLSSAQATALVQTQLEAYFSAIPIGGYDRGLGGKVFREAITGQIFQSSSQFIEVTLAAPVADVSLSANQVAVLGNVTITAIANIT